MREPQLVTVPAGVFQMGETAHDKFANDTERPAHSVFIARPFLLAVFPVTTGEFRHFRPGFAPGEEAELPVTNVTWLEAVAYAAWLQEQTGRPFRLPSEAEWEHAARAHSAGPYAFGDDLTLAQANFYYDEHGQRVGPGRRTPAGTYPPNAFGLQDLHGNVCEWVADCWRPTYVGAPADGSPWLEGGIPGRRVIRGGAWDYLPRLLRSAWRDSLPETSRRDNVGFRLASDRS